MNPEHNQATSSETGGDYAAVPKRRWRWWPWVGVGAILALASAGWIMVREQFLESPPPATRGNGASTGRRIRTMATGEVLVRVRVHFSDRLNGPIPGARVAIGPGGD